jgi:hypothetical protein
LAFTSSATDVVLDLLDWLVWELVEALGLSSALALGGSTRDFDAFFDGPDSAPFDNRLRSFSAAFRLAWATSLCRATLESLTSTSAFGDSLATGLGLERDGVLVTLSFFVSG